MFKKLLSNRSGSTAIEYSIIAGMISIAIVAGVTNVGSSTDKMYERIGENVQSTN